MLRDDIAWCREPILMYVERSHCLISRTDVDACSEITPVYDRCRKQALSIACREMTLLMSVGVIESMMIFSIMQLCIASSKVIRVYIIASETFQGTFSEYINTKYKWFIPV